MSEDQLYIHVHVSVIYNPCVTRLMNIFYGVILTPKQTIGIIINSLPIIIEKDYNYNAISTVSDEYFSSHSAEGKAHSVLISEWDSEYLNLSPVNICLSTPVVQFCNFRLKLIHMLLYISFISEISREFTKKHPNSPPQCKGLPFFIRPSKTGRIMGSPVAGGRAASSSLSGAYLQNYSTYGWIDLIEGECSAKES